MESTRAILARHQRIAFQFSGGRDSLAALYLLEAFWPSMTVYTLDAGDRFPEVQEIVDRVSRDVPITVVRGDAHAVQAAHGLPTDLLPVDNLPIGRVLSGREQPLTTRFECCHRSIMWPMHERMQADGITLIVRGVRASDFKRKHEFMSGHQSGGIELFYPIEDWTSNHVDEYLHARNLPIARFYREGLREAPECMGCTAWWGDGRLAYLRRHYPEKHADVTGKIRLIRAEIDRQYATLEEGAMP